MSQEEDLEKSKLIVELANLCFCEISFSLWIYFPTYQPTIQIVSLYSRSQFCPFLAKIAYNPASFAYTAISTWHQETAIARGPTSVASCKSLKFEGCSVVNATKTTACISTGTGVVPDPGSLTVTGVYVG